MSKDVNKEVIENVEVVDTNSQVANAEVATPVESKVISVEEFAKLVTVAIDRTTIWFNARNEFLVTKSIRAPKLVDIRLSKDKIDLIVNTAADDTKTNLEIFQVDYGVLNIPAEELTATFETEWNNEQQRVKEEQLKKYNELKAIFEVATEVKAEVKAEAEVEAK